MNQALRMDKQDLISKYLQGQLTDAEHHTLTELVDTDKAFAEELEIESAFYAKRNLQLKNELRSSKSSDKPDVGSRSGLYILLASLLLIIGAFILVRMCVQPEQKLKEPNYLAFLEQPFQAPAVSMGEETIQNDEWSRAIQAYRNNDFLECAQFLTAIPDRTDEQELYLGLSYLFSEDEQLVNNASSTLSHVINKSESKYKDIALWYVALSSLKQDDSASAQQHLQEIISSHSWNHERAAELLSQL